tara:strand:+ start:462 stop:1397 length:936 start_codon:yes stop_codon:yes gene_type:complete
MTKSVLVTNLMMLKEQDRFNEELTSLGLNPIFAEVNQFLNEEQLLKYSGNIDAILSGDDLYTEKVLRAFLPRLKGISKWGTGLDSFDLEAAKRLNVPIYNSPGAFDEAVSEVALGYIISLSRNLHFIDRSIREGAWPKISGKRLSGKNIGIIGLGAIGSSIAKKCDFLGMKVSYFDPCLDDKSTNIKFKKFEMIKDLLKISDFIIISCNANKDNKGLINKNLLKFFKKGSFLINVSRGSIINESDLIDALKDNILAGAALDVFEKEPIEKNNPLLGMNNVILGSHNANNEDETNELVHFNTLTNLKKILKI